MADQDKGIAGAIKEELPKVQLFHCARHRAHNVKSNTDDDGKGNRLGWCSTTNESYSYTRTLLPAHSYTCPCVVHSYQY
jgi:hypothetical protein